MKKLDKIKHEIMFSCLEILPYEILNDELLKHSCLKIDVNPIYSSILFPRGAIDFLEHFRDYIDKKLLSEMQNRSLGITEKIHLALCTRIDLLTPYKLSIQKIISFFSLPTQHFNLYSYIWHTADLIWTEIVKDTSTDFNYYSKRSLLALVYSSSLIYWMNDNSISHEKTKMFIMKNLNFIVKTAKFLKR